MGKKTLYVEGLEELRAALRKFPDAAKRGAKRGLTSGVIRVHRSAREYAPKDTGQAGLTGSITYKVESLVGGVRGIVGSAKFYAPYMEFGTKPHWPPPGALATWAERHGIPEFLVCRAIAQHGTKPRRFLRRAMIDNRNAVVDDLVRNIRAEIAKLAG